MAPRAVLRVASTVSKTLTQEGIQHALTGGIAVSFYGFARWTTALEFVVSRSARRTIQQLWTPVSEFMKGVVVTVAGVEATLWPVMSPPRETDLLLPTHRGDLPLLGLDALVALKTSTAGSTDIIEVLELLKLGKVSTHEVRGRLPAATRRQFQGLVTIAKLERQGKPKEGRRILMRMLAESARLKRPL